MISMRCPTDWLDEVEAFSDDRNEAMSEVIRSMTSIGMQVVHYQEMMKDPEKANEFQTKMRDVIEQGEVTKWVSTLELQQIEGFLGLLKLEKEGRIKVQNLL